MLQLIIKSIKSLIAYIPREANDQFPIAQYKCQYRTHYANPPLSQFVCLHVYNVYFATGYSKLQMFYLKENIFRKVIRTSLHL
jgi:hypothetical protein